jgi:hypothetical protein
VPATAQPTTDQANFSVVLPQLLELLLGLGKQRAFGSDQRHSAANLRAVLNATRIHAHEVESLEQGRREDGLGVDDVFRRAVARAARIEEQRSDALRGVLRRPSCDCQRDS